MLRHHPLALAAAMLILLTPGAALANARLTSVVARNGGCVAGPMGPHVEAWAVQPGMTYTLRLENVLDCANAGTDPSLGVLIMSNSLGGPPLTATRVAPGVYEFDYTVPTGACSTTPVLYGVIGGRPNTGFLAGRHDDGTAQSHLRASTFGTGCTNPAAISCGTVPTIAGTWGRLKSVYR